MTARNIVRILLSTMLAACAVDESPGETTAEQELGAAAGLGDINFDGVVDGQDAVDYITAWGIQIDTYQLVDDSYNPGTLLARRPYDWQVKVYGDPCLPSGVSRQQFPPSKV